MKLERIQELWSEDAKIDRDRLDEESLKIPQLHSKYYTLFSSERLTMKRMESDLDILKSQRYEFYDATISEEDLDERGWSEEFKNFGKKVLKSDIGRYLESDRYIIESNLKLALQKEKCLFLESILESIRFRSPSIKNAIDFLRFTNGN